MKKLLLSITLLTFSALTMASQLFFSSTGSIEQTKLAFSWKNSVIHYYNDDFVIGTAAGLAPANSVLLDNQAWTDNQKEYFLLFFEPETRNEYFNVISDAVVILYEAKDFMVVSTGKDQSNRLVPAIHGGIIRITNNAAVFPPRSIAYQPGSLQVRDEISDMISLVNMDTLEAFVQHLQDFGTRNAYKAGSIEAQNWILGKFQSYGLDVELHDFYMPGGQASDNVIATLTGTVYPDEYVVLGAHYDSYAGGDNEPGADDNATGTAGILEAARIMSQYQFDRSIIFATWSGEEYGLYGSDAWATEAASNEMNILGYFNIDMAGYLEPGDEIHTDIIAPASAGELKQFYKDVCAIYLPDFQTNNGALSGGDSDHTSFNNNGYQGIFPFEDSQNYSPYIHSSNDLIGPSVNNFEQHMIFVQATIASVASLSSQLPSPENLVAISGDMQVDLAWDAVEGAASYNIYRNSEPSPYANAPQASYLDTDVMNGTSYSYYVTAIFEDSGEESGPSNPVTVIPMPPIALPFYDDFETGAPYWSMEDTWGLQSGTFHSSEFALTESPDGNYAANMDASVVLRALNFTDFTSAQISFWTRYVIEDDYDYMYLEVSTNGADWDQIDYFTGTQNSWVQMIYSLDNYLDENNVIIRFRFTSDVYIEEQGMFIDDLEVTVGGIGITENKNKETNCIHFRPNPASNQATAIINLHTGGLTKIYLANAEGKTVIDLGEKWMETGMHSIDLDVSGLKSGVYHCILDVNGSEYSGKLVITR